MPETLSPAPRIPEYELARLIGRGSYGDVWLARGVTGAWRAVKIVRRDRFGELRPYEREFEGITRFTAISLREPSQLALLHAGRNDAEGFFYYVMELADDAERGRVVDPGNYTPLTLKELFVRSGRLPVAAVVEHAAALTRAVATLHAAGLVHRDIKPSNVILVGGTPKLADIGLVAAASAGAVTFVGTEGFVPPEGPGAPSADVFSLGKLLYELATGLDRNEFPALPSGIDEWADRREFLELNEIIIHACEPDPRQRYADAGAMLDDLRLLQAGKSVRRLRRAERQLARALRAAAVLALVAAVAATGAYVERRRADAELALREQAEAERDALARRTIYANGVGNAQIALRNGDYGKARQLLRELAPAPGAADLRGFEWRLLWGQAQGDPSLVVREEGDAINRLVLSPDSSLLAAVTAASEVLVYRTSDHRLVRTIPGVQRLAGFSGDGRSLLGTTPHNELARIGLDDGATVVRIGAAPFPLAVVGGRQVVALAPGNPARLLVWDSQTNSDSAVWEIDTATDSRAWEFFRGAASHDRRQVVIAWIRGRAGDDFRLTLIPLDRPGADPVHTRVTERVDAVGFDARGPWAILADKPVLWRADSSGTWRPTGEPVPPQTRRIAAAPGGVRVAADRDTLFWIDDGGAIVRTGRGHQGFIGDVTVSADGGAVYSATHAGELRAWPARAEEGRPIARRIWNSRGSTLRIVFSADSTQIVAPLDGGSVGAIDTATLETIRMSPGIRYPVLVQAASVLGVSADGRGLLEVPSDGTAARRRLAGAVGVLHAHSSRDGTAVLANDHAGRLWFEGSDGNERVVAADGFTNRFAQAADRELKFLWHTGRDNSLRCLNIADGTERWSVALPALAPGLALSPDERTLAIPLESGHIQVRSADTGNLLATSAVGGTTPQDAAFSRDGRRVLVACSRGEVACFETTGWTQVALLQLPTTEPLHAVSLAPDSTLLSAVTKSGEFHVLGSR